MVASRPGGLGRQCRVWCVLGDRRCRAAALCHPAKSKEYRWEGTANAVTSPYELMLAIIMEESQ